MHAKPEVTRAAMIQRGRHGPFGQITEKLGPISLIPENLFRRSPRAMAWYTASGNSIRAYRDIFIHNNNH
jgi:hypothetical protein